MDTQRILAALATEQPSVATALKFTALAFNAYAAKQYEEAAALFSQAAECTDITTVTQALLDSISDDSADGIEGTDTRKTVIEDEKEKVDEAKPSKEGANIVEESTEEVAIASEDSDEEEGSEEEGSDEEEEGVSVSTSRRRVTTMRTIAGILAASMEATASEVAEDEDAGSEEDSVETDVASDEADEDTEDEADPDVAGSALIPVSFSSVSVKGHADISAEAVSTSPIKIKV